MSPAATVMSGSQARGIRTGDPSRSTESDTCSALTQPQRKVDNFDARRAALRGLAERPSGARSAAVESVRIVGSNEFLLQRRRT
jgi:hypothetical protein